AAAAKLAKIDGDFHAKYFEDQPSEWSKMIASLTGADKDNSAHAPAPRGWFGLAAMNRQMAERRLAQDLTALTEAGSVQAACLDCRAYLPVVPRAGQAQAKGFLATLALLLK